jgi:thiamine monophosphate synthase
VNASYTDVSVILTIATDSTAERPELLQGAASYLACGPISTTNCAGNSIGHSGLAACGWLGSRIVLYDGEEGFIP